MYQPNTPFENAILIFLHSGGHSSYAASANHAAVVAHFKEHREIDLNACLITLEQRGMVKTYRDQNTFYYVWITPKGEVYARTAPKR